MEVEVHTMGAPILGCPGGPQRNRCDALDEESLCEPARITWYVWAVKRYTRSKTDLKETKQREDLRPEKRENGQHYLRPASYTLSKEEKESMFDCLNSMKVPSGYSSNMQGRINMKEQKFTNLKSHDCHVLMIQ